MAEQDEQAKMAQRNMCFGQGESIATKRVSTLDFKDTEELTAADKLRNVIIWIDFQNEYHFDGLSVRGIIALYDRCQEEDVDVIEDLPAICSGCGVKGDDILIEGVGTGIQTSEFTCKKCGRQWQEN